jgi:beta-1,4-N-acetylglucosaminyltransferase
LAYVASEQAAMGVVPHGRTADVVLICSAGGHLLQLWSLRSAWERFSRVWVVASFEQSDARSLLAGERLLFAHGPTARNLLNAFRNTVFAWRLLSALRPKAIVTTGAAVAVPFAWVAKVRRIPVVYVESLARTTSPSLSCRLIAPVADRVYVQWPELTSTVRDARYVGSVFSES